MAIYKAGKRKRAPSHPGALLRLDVLPALALTVSQAARDLGVSRQLLHRILGEQAPVSPEMAVKLGRLVGDGADIWLRMQASYDLWHARAKIGAAIAKVPERHRALRA